MQSPLRESINAKDSQGFNCLYYACYHGHLSIVQLLKKVNIEYEKDNKGTSCLHVAIQRGHLAIVDFLLKKTPKSLLSDQSVLPSVNKNGSKQE